MITLWRNARIATCDPQAQVFERGAVVTEGGRIAWVGDEREMPAVPRAERTIELVHKEGSGFPGGIQERVRQVA